MWAGAPALFVHGEWQELNSSTSPATCGASFPPTLGGLIQVGCGDGSRDAAWLSSQPQHRLCQRWFVPVFAVKLHGFIFQLFPLSAFCSLWERDHVPKHPLKRAAGREALRGASSCSLLPPPNFSPPPPAAQTMPATCQLPPAPPRHRLGAGTTVHGSAEGVRDLGLRWCCRRWTRCRAARMFLHANCWHLYSLRV